MNTFKFEIVTPAGSEEPRDIVLLDVPADGGRLTVLARHQPFVCSLKQGVTRVRNPDGSGQDLHTGTGVLTVTPQLVTMLVDAVT